MSRIRKVALLGAGVIGAGWAARLALNGLDVALVDPDPEAERKVTEVRDNALRAWRRLAPATLDRLGPIALVGDLEAAVQDADFLQESAPEREDLKRDLLSRASRYSPLINSGLEGARKRFGPIGAAMRSSFASGSSNKSRVEGLAV